jgi:hypothetical protein
MRTGFLGQRPVGTSTVEYYAPSDGYTPATRVTVTVVGGSHCDSPGVVIADFTDTPSAPPQPSRDETGAIKVAKSRAGLSSSLPRAIVHVDLGARPSVRRYEATGTSPVRCLLVT